MRPPEHQAAGAAEVNEVAVAIEKIQARFGSQGFMYEQPVDVELRLRRLERISKLGEIEAAEPTQDTERLQLEQVPEREAVVRVGRRFNQHGPAG